MKDRILWANAQLHNHSPHSDGRAPLDQMIDLLAGRGAKLLALTDHNTASGNHEFLRLCKEKGVIGIRGNEISTFYGHVVGLGVDTYVDWRGYRPDDPEAIFDEIHALGGLCGYAHPIRIGYPIVPSCSWLFKIHDYSKIDYFEILNTGDYLRSRNDLVIGYWLNKLREGFLHLGAVSGLDYHARPFHGHEYVTYVGLRKGMADGEKEALAAIKAQRMIVCKDKLISITLEDEAGDQYLPGETVPPTALRVRLCPADGMNMPCPLVMTVDDQGGRRVIKNAGDGVPVRPERFAVISLYDGEESFDRLIALSNPFLVART